MARKQQTEQWAEHQRQCAEEERRSRVMVITEFDAGDPEATMHAMATAILEYRLALKLLADAIGWADAGILARAVNHWRRRLLCSSACSGRALSLSRSSGPKSCLVGARACSLNPVDWKCMAASAGVNHSRRGRWRFWLGPDRA
jgi:hypothetical protein